MSAPADKSEDPWNDKTKEKFNTKSRSQWLDPCQEAASKSIKCLNRNGGDRAMCQEYFQAYRDCKKNWINARQKEVDCLVNIHAPDFPTREVTAFHQP